MPEHDNLAKKDIVPRSPCGEQGQRALGTVLRGAALVGLPSVDGNAAALLSARRVHAQSPSRLRCGGWRGSQVGRQTGRDGVRLGR